MKEYIEMQSFIEQGDNEAAKELIDKGIDINVTNEKLEKLVFILTQGAKSVETPLSVACRSRNIELIDYLLSKGANPNLVNYGLEYPLVTYLSYCYGKEPTLLGKFINAGADLNMGRYISPLAALMSNYYMADDNNRRIIESLAELLLCNGASWVNGIKKSQREGDSILHFVAATSELEFLKKLFSIKEAKKYTNLQNVLGYTPLHMAAINEQYEVYEFLIRMGGDEKIKDKKGFTPKDYL